VIERYELQAGQGRSGIGLAEEWNYVASLFVIGDGISPDRRDGLERRIADYLVEEKQNVLGGVSSPALGGLAVKILARAAPDLASVQQELWRMIRDDLWGLPPVSLRRY
jgi:urease accessory protein